jgi:hypothetical protein
MSNNKADATYHPQPPPRSSVVSVVCWEAVCSCGWESGTFDALQHAELAADLHDSYVHHPTQLLGD